MRIIGWVNKNSGVSYHRIMSPLLLMPDIEVFITNNLLEEHFEKGCDLLVYSRVLPDHADEKIKELQKKYGFKICVDIDDHWHLDPDHILYDEYQETNFESLQIRHLTEADVVTTTHSRLADEMLKYNRNVHILPNAIPKVGQFKMKREQSEEVRLFWQGSDTHQKDIAILAEPIENLGSLFGRVKMVMAGYSDESDTWYQMAMDYTAQTKHLYKLIPPAEVDKYYRAYQHADICLVPLRQTKFNGFKSNLKVLEAANLGLPVIASEVNPYLGLPVRYANNTSDWQRHIRQLAGSKRLRRDEGLRLKEYCDKYFSFKKINEERKQIFEHTIVHA